MWFYPVLGKARLCSCAEQGLLWPRLRSGVAVGGGGAGWLQHSADVALVVPWCPTCISRMCWYQASTSGIAAGSHLREPAEWSSCHGNHGFGSRGNQPGFTHGCFSQTEGLVGIGRSGAGASAVQGRVWQVLSPRRVQAAAAEAGDASLVPGEPAPHLPAAVGSAPSIAAGQVGLGRGVVVGAGL